MSDHQNRHKTSKHRATSSSAANTAADDDAASSGPAGLMAGPTGAPCGACKFLRRKCVSGCVFAPHFGSDQGSARFAAVHKVFGASNVSKLLLHIPASRRNDAVVTICYEAQARLSDPVYGCVSTIFALQQQVASLQAELAIAQGRLMNNRLASANAFPQQQQQQVPILQPTYSNNSSASTNLLNMNSFNSNFDFTNETASLQLSLPCHRDDHEEEEESGNQLVSFANQIILHHR